VQRTASLPIPDQIGGISLKGVGGKQAGSRKVYGELLGTSGSCNEGVNTSTYKGGAKPRITGQQGGVAAAMHMGCRAEYGMLQMMSFVTIRRGTRLNTRVRTTLGGSPCRSRKETQERCESTMHRFSYEH
jgi:hypothetical protein